VVESVVSVVSGVSVITSRVVVSLFPQLDELLLPELSFGEVIGIPSLLEGVPVVRVPVGVVMVALEAHAPRTEREFLGLRMNVEE